MLTPEELEALNTPLKNMTPALLALAVAAREKKALISEEENKNFKPEPREKRLYVQVDYEAIKSPVTGKMIEGRRALREHLKETGCRIVDPSESKAHKI